MVGQGAELGPLDLLEELSSAQSAVVSHRPVVEVVQELRDPSVERGQGEELLVALLGRIPFETFGRFSGHVCCG